MSSGYSTKWERFLYKLPFLYKQCPEGNYHKITDRLCFCRVNEFDGTWHGGIYDFKTSEEYQYCERCKEE